MNQYKSAREKTKNKIQEAYFSLYLENKKINVSDICRIAKIHRSTFYYYYEWVDDVLVEIKNRLMELLKSTLSSENRKNKNYQEVTRDLRIMFQENKKYLIPLVLEQKGGDFALQYREYLKNEFAKDIGLEYKTSNNVKNDVASCVLAGLIEIQLYEFNSEIMPQEYTYNKGLRRTLIDDLNMQINED
jgi:AcrR family transcriptional regulator